MRLDLRLKHEQPQVRFALLPLHLAHFTLMALFRPALQDPGDGHGATTNHEGREEQREPGRDAADDLLPAEPEHRHIPHEEACDKPRMKGPPQPPRRPRVPSKIEYQLI